MSDDIELLKKVGSVLYRGGLVALVLHEYVKTVRVDLMLDGQAAGSFSGNDALMGKVTRLARAFCTLHKSGAVSHQVRVEYYLATPFFADEIRNLKDEGQLPAWLAAPIKMGRYQDVSATFNVQDINTQDNKIDGVKRMTLWSGDEWIPYKPEDK